MVQFLNAGEESEEEEEEKDEDGIPPQNYNDCEVKPGILFYKLFLANAKRNNPMKLRINIPSTIGLFHEKFMMWTSSKLKLIGLLITPLYR